MEVRELHLRSVLILWQVGRWRKSLSNRSPAMHFLRTLQEWTAMFNLWQTWIVLSKKGVLSFIETFGVRNGWSGPTSVFPARVVQLHVRRLASLWMIKTA